ncbi:MAG TPA: esterase-like activity of phytase family protein, partial [Allosphingosinicella sp.]|nr:esterase-like activity of phytase family protein [Allosphingosinicella sp.]
MRKLLSLLGLAAAGCASVQPLEPTGVIPLTVRAVELDSTHPGRSILGRLRYLGGVELSSPDKRLGGISSLKWRGGNLHAVTDVGDWLT